MSTYKIIRHYYRELGSVTIKTGLTLEEAQEHCSDRESSSSTCTNSKAKARTAMRGPWFDGYIEESYAERINNILDGEYGK